MAREFNNILETVGRTPLVKLNSIVKNIKSKIYVKVEYSRGYNNSNFCSS